MVCIARFSRTSPRAASEKPRADSGTGIALVEGYDISGGAASRLVNLSSHGYVGTGASIAIPGFVVSGNGPRTLLIRGVGPTPANFGVSNVLGDPRITLVNSSQAVVAENDNWGAAPDLAVLTAATSAVHAFGLTAGSTNAAMLVTVPPGLYTVLVSGANNGAGNAIVEIYDVP